MFFSLMLMLMGPRWWLFPLSLTYNQVWSLFDLRLYSGLVVSFLFAFCCHLIINIILPCLGNFYIRYVHGKIKQLIYRNILDLSPIYLCGRMVDSCRFVLTRTEMISQFENLI